MSDTARIIEFERPDGKYRIEVNPDDRITYGQIAPGTSRGGGGYALRIYSGNSKDHTRAVFSDVTAFREITIPVQRLAVRAFGSEEWYVDDGRYTNAANEQVERQWVNGDEIRPGNALVEVVPEPDEYPTKSMTWQQAKMRRTP